MFGHSVFFFTPYYFKHCAFKHPNYERTCIGLCSQQELNDPEYVLLEKPE